MKMNGAIIKTPFDFGLFFSTIGGNREMDQLYATSQVSNTTRKKKFLHMFSKMK